jgi:hypothetical protein
MGDLRKFWCLWKLNILLVSLFFLFPVKLFFQFSLYRKSEQRSIIVMWVESYEFIDDNLYNALIGTESCPQTLRGFVFSAPEEPSGTLGTRIGLPAA